ncbi:heat shock 70 kDa protein C precursor [Reticulomyxa filosa]|uniref:Heat shock 70 kDa protein C n=1 Tax=Reticulomyxa filosa TaxID=46433 RepID=X6NA33_RETFI|nr:heat shock 70 kDa protein C precursor [Reticulomyxa filosa]|eukprot:ETO22624.1 heat shock 70 kDa protein C precursor [Reticulomyxa filosa]
MAISFAAPNIKEQCRFGLSIGASKSCAVWNDGKTDVKVSIPSYMILREKGEPLFGDEAEMYELDNLEKEKTCELWKLMTNESMLEGVTKEKLLLLFVKHMKERIEGAAKKEMAEVVVAIPEIWEEEDAEGDEKKEKKQKKKASMIESLVAKEIGLASLTVINENAAALIAYRLNSSTPNNEKRQVLVINMGGKNTTVSLVSVSNKKMEQQAIIRTLGGDACTDKLVDHFAEKFGKQSTVIIEKDKKAIQRLKKACIQLKHKLSASKSAKVNIKSIVEGSDFELEMTRNEF